MPGYAHMRGIQAVARHQVLARDAHVRHVGDEGGERTVMSSPQKSKRVRSIEKAGRVLRKTIGQREASRRESVREEYGDVPCVKKHGYTAQWSAERAAERCETKRGVRLRTYRCPYCGMWHLTSKVGDKSERV